MLLQQVRKPDCSPSLLMMFVRTQFPEKYGPVRRDNAPRNTNRCDHQCEHDPLPPPTSRYDLQLLEEISRDLQNLKQFARLSEPNFTPPNPDPNLSPTARDTVTPVLSLAGGEIQRGGIPTDQTPVGPGLKPAHDPSAPDVASPPTPSPVLGESLPRTRYGGRGEGPAPTTQNHDPDRSSTDQTPVEPGFRPAPDLSSNGSHPGSAPQHQAPSTQNPEPALNRRQRRELQRRAKRQKSRLARAPN